MALIRSRCYHGYWDGLLAVVITTLLSSHLCAGKKCETLDGVWYNQMGSQMTLSHNTDGSIHGEYRTAVERSQGTAGSTHSRIHGASPFKPGAVFGFAVMWNQGASMTAWTGQCHMCGDDQDREVLMTSWVLRSQVWSCQDKWKSTLIGQDYFTREEQNDSPHEDEATDTPGDTDNAKKLRRRDLAMVKRDAGDSSKPTCSFDGDWYNELGSQMSLRHDYNDYISGQYKTAVELKEGMSSRHHSVYGVGNKDNVNTTMAVFVVWSGGASITGWVGQCHLCGQKNDIETIETTWLLRQSVDTCHGNWKSTLHGQNSFTRQQQDNSIQKILGVDTPGEEGEDVAYVLVDSPCSAATFTSWVSLAACASHIASQFCGLL